MKCIKCGHGRLKRATATHRIGVGKIQFKGDLAVSLCPKCNESFARAEDLADFERRIARRLAEKGPVTGETFRFMRKAIGLPAKELAVLLATVPETISRWEKGGRDVDRNAWIALSALVLDELAGGHAMRQRLRSLSSKPPAKTKAIDLEARTG